MQKSTKKLSSKKPLRKAKQAIKAKQPARPEDYQVVLEWSDEDDCYLATIPAWDNVRTHGRTLAEASRNAQEVLEMLIESAHASGDAIPEPQRSYSGKLQLRLPTSLHQRLAREAEREGVSLNHWLTAKLAG
jgi:predicted RNase H-like HicB family nuclease